MNKAKLILPANFEDYSWEVEAKGWFSEAIAEFEDKIYSLTFYDATRLAQDIEEELLTRPSFTELNTVVVNHVSPHDMQNALDYMAISGGFSKLKANE